MTATWTSLRLIDPLTEGKPAEVAQTIERLVRVIDNAETDIRTGNAWVADTVARADRVLSEGGRLNNLGVYQRVPADVDVAVARRDLAIDVLGSLVGVDATTALLAARVSS